MPEPMNDNDRTAKPEVDKEALNRKETDLRLAEESRIQKSKAEAEAAGKGPGKPEKGTNPDG